MSTYTAVTVPTQFVGNLDDWNPFPAVGQIIGHIAFYPERVDEIAELAI